MIKKLILSVILISVMGGIAYADKEPIVPPVIMQEGTFKVPVSAVPTIIFSNIPTGSKVFYTVDGQDPITNGIEYQKGFKLFTSTFWESVTVKAVANKNDAYSDTVEQIYSQVRAYPVPKLKSIIYKVKRGNKTIKGRIWYKNQYIKSPVKAYVEVKVYIPGEKTKRYKVNVENGKWKINLKKKIVTKNIVVANVYTKEKFICYKNMDNKVTVGENVPSWKMASQKVK